MSRPTLDTAMQTRLSLTGLSPSLVGFPKTVLLDLSDHVRGPKPRSARTPVWPLPISLAATFGIDVSFSSSPYLDVSVQAVPLRTLWIGVRMTGLYRPGFPIQISADQCLFAAPRSFSQLITSFFGS